jgi:hypothetical protein
MRGGDDAGTAIPSVKVDFEEQPTSIDLYAVDSWRLLLSWRLFVWIGLLIAISFQPESEAVSNEHTAIIPQYAPYFPYSVSLMLDRVFFAIPVKVWLAFLSRSPTPITVSYNISIGSASYQIRGVTFSPNESLRVFHDQVARPSEIRFNFEPGLSPTDNLHFRVDYNAQGGRVLHPLLQVGFSVALLFECVSYCLVSSGTNPILQTLTIFLQVVGILADIPFSLVYCYVPVGFVHALGDIFNILFREVCFVYAAALFSNIVSDRLTKIWTATTVMALTVAVSKFLNWSGSLWIDFLLKGAFLGLVIGEVVLHGRRQVRAWRMGWYLAVLGAFAALEVCVTQAAPGKVGAREFLLANGFVIVMSIMHTVQVVEMEYHHPGEDKLSGTLGIEEEVKDGEEGFPDPGD